MRSLRFSFRLAASRHNSAGASAALQIALVVALLSTSAMLLASPHHRRQSRRQVTATAVTSAPSALTGMTFTVTSTGDASGSTCGVTCTLRQAINASNANPTDASMPNTIAFNIPAIDPNCDATTHVCTITPSDALEFFPHITEPVIIDGYTQPGASPNTLSVGDNAVLLIKIDCSHLTIDRRLFFLESRVAFGGAGDSSGSTIKGLVIDNMNDGLAIFIEGDNNKITGNFFGLEPDGSTQLDHLSFGVEVSRSGSALAQGNIIGGTTPADRNIITTGAEGVEFAASRSTVVQGNYIGTNAAGTVHLTTAVGVELAETSFNLIGGTAPGAGNLIDGDFEAIDLHGTHNTIQGNLIGTDVTGTIGFGGSFGI